jgi:hypothetical protein
MYVNGRRRGGLARGHAFDRDDGRRPEVLVTNGITPPMASSSYRTLEHLCGIGQ